jgi:hypothetical protein
MNNIAVINVKGKAFFKNLLRPLLKFFLSKLSINETECLKECIKQKYKAKAARGERK